VIPPARIQSATIETYDDHRMAMAFSLVAAATETVILDPDCTAKTFPGYFEALRHLSAANG
jgi:3-phosphoshikimate 1-carboxyvinyltransferase